MNTDSNANNKRLQELVSGADLTQIEALAIFNRKLGVRPLSLSAWKSYFCKPETKRHRRFTDELLIVAEKVFAPFQS